MEGRPSIRVKLMFHDNPHGADPATTVEGVLTFPGRGYKGVVKPGQLWDCDVVFASHNYVMIAPRAELEDALDSELGVLRLHQGAREVAHLKLNDTMDLLRSGQIPPPALTPRPLPPRRPTLAPAKPSPAPTAPPAAPARPPTTTPADAPPPAPAVLPVGPTTAPAAPPPSASAATAVSPPTAIPHVPPQPAPPARTEPAPAQAASAAEVKSIVPAQPSTPAPSPASPSRPASSSPSPSPALRTADDWKRLLDAPEGRALVELLADRLGVSSALPRIEDTIDGQEEILSVLRGEAGDVRKSVKDLGAQIEDLRKQTLAWRRKENQDLRGVPKPVPVDTERPTDQEVEREIIHQLYQKNCWGNKYGQYEKLKRGYNSKASDRQIRAAVQRLQEKRWILIYAKDTDQFRLNPARAEDVYRFLGVADRAAEQLAEETRDELEEPASLTKRDLDQAIDGLATRADVERLVAPLRQKVSALEDRAPQALPAVEASSARSGELAEIKGMLKGLQGELNRIKKLAEDTASAQRRLEARLDAQLAEGAEG